MKVSAAGLQPDPGTIPTITNGEGAAALAICESLLIALTDLKIMSAVDVRGLLTDVVAAHSEAAQDGPAPERYRAVATIVQGILDTRVRPVGG